MINVSLVSFLFITFFFLEPLEMGISMAYLFCYEASLAAEHTWLAYETIWWVWEEPGHIKS